MALKYQKMAGKQVLRLSAYKEAIEYFEVALGCMSELRSTDQITEIDIRIKLGVCLKTVYGWNNLRAISQYDKIMQLSEKNGNANIEELAPIIFGRWAAVMMRLEFQTALKLAEQYLKFAQSTDNFEVLMQAHLTVANNLYWIGEIDKALIHIEQSLQYHKDLNSTELIEKVGYEPVTMVYMLKTWCIWNKGQINEAEAILTKSLSFANSFKHPFTEAIVLQAAAWHYYHALNVDQCLLYAQKLVDLSKKFSLAFYEGVGLLFKGWAIAKLGNCPEGIHAIKQANDRYINPDKGKFLNSLFSCVLADVLLENDQAKEAKKILDKALTIALNNDEKPYLPELYRLLAEEAVTRNSFTEAKQQLTNSIEFSSGQNMLLYKLRSSLDLVTIKLMNEDESGIATLKKLIKQFKPKCSSPELIEARQLINDAL